MKFLTTNLRLMRYFNLLIIVAAIIHLGSCADKTDEFGGPTAEVLNQIYGSGFNDEVLRDVSISPDGTVFVSTQSKIYKLNSTGQASVFVGSNTRGLSDGQGANATFTSIGLFSFDDAGNIYAVDSLNIRKITPQGNVSTLIINDPYGLSFYVNPPMNYGIVAKGGSLFVAGPGSIVTKLTNNSWNIFAGGEYLEQGFKDGQGYDARFSSPQSIILDQSGTNLIVGDGGALRKVSIADSIVTTITGAANFGVKDGDISEARYEGTSDVAIDKNGVIYIASFSRVRRITLDGKVTTIAGPQRTDGSQIKVGGLAVDANANYLYLTDLSKKALLIRIDLTKIN